MKELTEEFKHMLNAIELFANVSKHADKYFLIFILSDANPENLIYDLKAIASSGIKSLVFIDKDHPEYKKNSSDLKVLYSEPIEMPDPEVLCENSDSSNNTLIISDRSLTAPVICDLTSGFDNKLSKIIIISQGSYEGLTNLKLNHKNLKHDMFLSHVNKSTPDSPLHWLKPLAGLEERDVVFCPDTTGGLFREIFTHRGFGTLISDDYENNIFKAGDEDILDILMIVRPDVEEKLILPVSAASIRANLNNYFTYKVNGNIVALASLTEYGEAMELGKFCTLPRYRSRGRAKELALHLIEISRQMGKKYVFALSIAEDMIKFFSNLGFSQVDRTQLPESWQENYDMTRKSTALKLNIQ